MLKEHLMELRNICQIIILRALYSGLMESQDAKSSVLTLDLSGEIRNEENTFKNYNENNSDEENSL